MLPNSVESVRLTSVRSRSVPASSVPVPLPSGRTRTRKRVVISDEYGDLSISDPLAGIPGPRTRAELPPAMPATFGVPGPNMSLPDVPAFMDAIGQCHDNVMASSTSDHMCTAASFVSGPLHGRGRASVPIPAATTAGGSDATGNAAQSTAVLDGVDCDRCDIDGIVMRVLAEDVAKLGEYFNFRLWGANACPKPAWVGDQFLVRVATHPYHVLIPTDSRAAFLWALNSRLVAYRKLHDSAHIVTARPYRIGSRDLVLVLTAANIPEVKVQIYGFKQTVRHALAFIGRVQEGRVIAASDSRSSPNTTIVLDVSRSFPTRVRDGSTVEILRLNIQQHTQDDNVLKPTPCNAGAPAPSQLTREWRPAQPILRRAASRKCPVGFKLYPILGTLGDMDSGGFKLTLKVRRQ